MNIGRRQIPHDVFLGGLSFGSVAEVIMVCSLLSATNLERNELTRCYPFVDF